MPAFVPDIPYHIQAVFVFTFSYIWIRAFTIDPDYSDPLPENDFDAWHAIVWKCVWQSIQSSMMFMLAFAYLNPYIETVQNPWLQRATRCVVNLMLFYHCFLIYMLN